MKGISLDHHELKPEKLDILAAFVRNDNSGLFSNSKVS